MAFTMLFMRQRISKSLCIKEMGTYFNKDYVSGPQNKKTGGERKKEKC